MISKHLVLSWFGTCRQIGDVPDEFTELIVEAQNAHDDGWLFVPATNALFDGRETIPQAFAAGAGAVVVDEVWFAEHATCSPAIVVPTDAYQLLVASVRQFRNRIAGDVFAVSGSAGKTTTRAILSAFLRGAGGVCETSENSNSGGGQCEVLLRSTAKDKYVVSEVGICGPGQMQHSCRLLQPSVAILTSIGTAHVGNFKGREQLAREKIRIFDKLWGANAFGVVSREMDFIQMAREKAKCLLVEVSFEDPTAPFYGKVIDVLSGEMLVREHGTGIETRLKIGRPGRHICADALLAFAAARGVGVSSAQCVEGLKTLDIPGNRWRKVVRNGVTYIDDTFNANAASMKAVLSLVKSMPGRVIAVLGDMLELGGHTEELHREVGRFAAHSLLDEFVVFGPCSVSYMADEYDKELPRHKALRANSLQDVRQLLGKIVEPGDTVVLKASNGMGLGAVIEEAK